MKALTYIEHGKFALLDKPKPIILDPRDALTTDSLSIHRHPVTGLHGGCGRTYRLHHTHHLMANRDAGNRLGHGGRMPI